MNRFRIRKQWHPSLGLLLWLAVSAGAHSGERVFPISYLSDEMLSEIRLDDGSIDEWIEFVGEPTMTLLDFWEQGERHPISSTWTSVSGWVGTTTRLGST